MEDNNERIEDQRINEEQKGMSILSMILGIVGLLLASSMCGILAINFAILGKKKGGIGFARAGLILGIIDIIYGIVDFYLWFL